MAGVRRRNLRQPAAIAIHKKNYPPAVYAHIVVAPDGAVVRAYLQYYVFLLGAHVPLSSHGPVAERRDGHWQLVQIELVKARGAKAFRPLTVGC